jgi:methylase of polypeptide subunit release factors
MIDWIRARWGLLRTRRVVVGGLDLLVPPGVLDPVLFRSGAWFAAQVAARVVPGASVLDLGCGTGVVGLMAQARGGRVTAVDRDARAVAAARTNGLGRVLEGDLFAPVAGETFDLVAFNPPYLRGEPGRRALGHALYAGPDFELLRRFHHDLPTALSPGGEALVVVSDNDRGARLALGPEWSQIDQSDVADETLRLLRYAVPHAKKERV